jgi:hypothetical protein
MSEHQENLGSFFKENSKLAKEYFETQMQIYRLKAVKLISKSAGYLIWIIISLFLLFLFMIFLGTIIGLWLSNITGSYIEGFGITTLALLVIIIILALLRKTLFVTPIIKTFIHHSEESTTEKE